MSENVHTIATVLDNGRVMQLRTIEHDEQTLFCLADVCKGCGLASTAHAAKAIKEEFSCPTLNVGQVPTASGAKSAIFITEQQLYFVLLRGRSDAAKEFRFWVYQVLESIRAHGAYSHEDARDDFADDVSLAGVNLGHRGHHHASDLTASDMRFFRMCEATFRARGLRGEELSDALCVVVADLSGIDPLALIHLRTAKGLEPAKLLQAQLD